MATYTPTPDKLKDKYGAVYIQPLSVDRANLALNTDIQTTINGYNTPSLLKPYSEVIQWTINDEHTIFESANSVCKITMTYTGIPAPYYEDYQIRHKIYYNGTEIYSYSQGNRIHPIPYYGTHSDRLYQ